MKATTYKIVNECSYLHTIFSGKERILKKVYGAMTRWLWHETSMMMTRYSIALLSSLHRHHSIAILSLYDCGIALSLSHCCTIASFYRTTASSSSHYHTIVIAFSHHRLIDPCIDNAIVNYVTPSIFHLDQNQRICLSFYHTKYMYQNHTLMKTL